MYLWKDAIIEQNKQGRFNLRYERWGRSGAFGYLNIQIIFNRENIHVVAFFIVHVLFISVW